MAYDKTHILHPSNEKAFIDSFLDLYRTNGEHFNKAIEKSSKQKRSIKLAILIDKANGMPVFESTISMVTADPLKDHRRVTAEDPDQFSIPFDQQEAVKPLEVINIKAQVKKTKKAKR